MARLARLKKIIGDCAGGVGVCLGRQERWRGGMAYASVSLMSRLRGVGASVVGAGAAAAGWSFVRRGPSLIKNLFVNDVDRRGKTVGQ